MRDHEPVVEYDEISDAYIVRCPACGADQPQEDAYQGELGGAPTTGADTAAPAFTTEENEAMMTGFTVRTWYSNGVCIARRLERHGVAMAAQDETMKEPDVVRCEIEDNISGLIQGRAKPAAVRN